ncbi:MAG: tetratricopeptide repeat protein [Goleter apudmare HA4340-LM2]|jgi:tetratricopeptide (TPR) repeat protein|nr:tetratricopeptide repeat protein [Goleter apudmare HA4340-LM2]
MKCPVCGAVYRPTKQSTGAGETFPSPTCRRCKADLSDLLRLHDQAIWYHRQALHLCSQGRYAQAAAQNNAALALYSSNADFHALAGKLSALQGEFREAIASWQQALKFDPQNAVAGDCLQMIKMLTS